MIFFSLHSRPRHNREGEAAYKGATQDHNFPADRHSHLEPFFEKEEKRETCVHSSEKERWGKGGGREDERMREKKRENEKHVPRSLSRLGEWCPPSLGLTSEGRVYDGGKTFAGGAWERPLS